MSKIPDLARDRVRTRARFHCERCRTPAPNGHVHHRRGRSVVDAHTHCPCNLVLLCPACHTWVHQHPAETRVGGWIISRWTEEPVTITVATPWGERTHGCDGTYKFTARPLPRSNHE